MNTPMWKGGMSFERPFKEPCNSCFNVPLWNISIASFRSNSRTDVYEYSNRRRIDLFSAGYCNFY